MTTDPLEESSQVNQRQTLAPGPLLHDGRQSLVSDDNFNRSQTTRVIVLAVARDLL